jgi:hypothetical protein
MAYVRALLVVPALRDGHRTRVFRTVTRG